MGAAAARLALVVQVPPEVDGRAIHTVAAAQRDRAAAVGADGLRRGVGGRRDGLVGVGVVGGFHRVGFLCTAVSYPRNGRFACLICAENRVLLDNHFNDLSDGRQSYLRRVDRF